MSLRHSGGLAAFDHPAARDDHGGDTRVDGGLGHVRGPEWGEGDERDVRALRECLERRIAGLAQQLGVFGVHEVAAGGAIHVAEVVADRPRDPAPCRRADDRDRGRVEDRPQVDGAVVARGGGRVDLLGAGGHPTTRSTPRFSRARAMIRRWISDVPSQMRSTRSSRKNRSAAVSRM